MFDIVRDILTSNNLNVRINEKLLLFGHENLSYKDNCKIFESVQSFIRRSNRNP